MAIRSYLGSNVLANRVSRIKAHAWLIALAARRQHGQRRRGWDAHPILKKTKKKPVSPTLSTTYLHRRASDRQHGLPFVATKTA